MSGKRRSTKPGEPQEFLMAAVESETDECILWPYGKTSGYGSIRYLGRARNASHVVCLLAHGNPPLGERYEAAHGACHDRSCINPRHLRWATKAENAEDRKRDGTNPAGVKHPLAKLNDNAVREIRSLYASGGVTLEELGNRYGVQTTAVCKVVHRKRWNHIQ